jgi:hypothetical protein
MIPILPPDRNETLLLRQTIIGGYLLIQICMSGEGSASSGEAQLAKS